MRSRSDITRSVEGDEVCEILVDTSHLTIMVDSTVAATAELDDLPMQSMSVQTQGGTADIATALVIPWRLVGCSISMAIGAIAFFSRTSSTDAAIFAGYSLEAELQGIDGASEEEEDAEASPFQHNTHDQDASRHKHVDERQFLFDRGFIKKGDRGAEIGVFNGTFSEAVLRNRPPASLTLIDPWVHQEYVKRWYSIRDQAAMDRLYQSVLTRFRREIEKGVVKVMRGYSHDMMAKVPRDSLDWVYVDGDHSTKNVLDDCTSALRAVRVGGYIIADDWQWRDRDANMTRSVKVGIEAFLLAHADHVKQVELLHDQCVMKRIK